VYAIPLNDGVNQVAYYITWTSSTCLISSLLTVGLQVVSILWHKTKDYLSRWAYTNNRPIWI